MSKEPRDPEAEERDRQAQVAVLVHEIEVARRDPARICTRVFMPGHYILGGADGKTPVEATDLILWARWLEIAERRVRQDLMETDFGKIEVSTVFLGLDANYSGEGEPVLFETMIFHEAERLDIHDWQCRSHTWEEAEEIHVAALAFVRQQIEEHKDKRGLIEQIEQMGRDRGIEPRARPSLQDALAEVREMMEAMGIDPDALPGAEEQDDALDLGFVLIEEGEGVLDQMPRQDVTVHIAETEERVMAWLFQGSTRYSLVRATAGGDPVYCIVNPWPNGEPEQIADPEETPHRTFFAALADAIEARCERLDTARHFMAEAVSQELCREEAWVLLRGLRATSEELSGLTDMEIEALIREFYPEGE